MMCCADALSLRLVVVGVKRKEKKRKTEKKKKPTKSQNDHNQLGHSVHKIAHETNQNRRVLEHIKKGTKMD